MTEFDLISVLMREVLVVKDDMYKLKEKVLAYETTLERIKDVVTHCAYSTEAVATIKKILEVNEDA